MANIRDYFKSRVETLRLPMSDADINSLFIKHGLVVTDEQTAENIRMLDILVLMVIPDLLLLPDKTTGDTSLKWDRNAIYKYYKLKCGEYGFDDGLSQENSITFIDDFY